MSESLSIREALGKYKKIVQPVRGISMLPMLDEDKDAVELVEVKGCLKKYDLVLFQRRNGQMVLHRIIAVKKHHCLICGDNSTAVEKVPMERILAVASGFYKDGKYVSCQNEEYLAYVIDRWTDFSSRKLIQKPPREESLDVVEHRTRKAVNKQGAGKYIWSRIFIPYRQMCMYYPCLWRLPFLLPVFWIVRLVRSLFHTQKRRKLKTELKVMTNKKNG
jgi:hypothetical protein